MTKKSDLEVIFDAETSKEFQICIVCNSMLDDDEMTCWKCGTKFETDDDVGLLGE